MGNHLREKRAIIRATKDVPCADCGRSYPPYVMDFDHLGGKAFNISEACRDRSVEDLLKEISKCDVVCSNCHREREHQRRTGS